MWECQCQRTVRLVRGRTTIGSIIMKRLSRSVDEFWQEGRGVCIIFSASSHCLPIEIVASISCLHRACAASPAR